MNIDPFTKLDVVDFGAFVSTFNVQVPPFQRSVVAERVDKFVEVLKNFFEHFGSVMSLGVITLGKLTTTNEYFLLDGQHRFMSYKTFSEKYDLDGMTDFKVPLVIREVESLEELKAFFCAINDHFAPPDFMHSVETLDRAQILKNHLTSTYASFLSPNRNTHFPRVHLDTFVAFALERLPAVPSEELVARFEELNASVGQALKVADETERFLKIHQKGGLFLVHSYCRMNTKQRQALPSSVRNDVWTRRFATSTEGQCAVCSAKVQFPTGFHVGHIVPVAHGGTDHIDNLEVVCAPCNHSMGVTNLHAFREKYYGI